MGSRVALLVVLAGILALAVPLERGTGAVGRSAKLVRVISGDTVYVRFASGRVERVRIVGIDAPDRRACFHRQATALARRMALGRRAWIVGDTVTASSDQAGRRLAYVDTVYWGDLGARLLERGYARMYVAARPLDRHSWYASIERQAYRKRLGLWGRCAPRQRSMADLAVSLRRVDVAPSEPDAAVALEATVTNTGPATATGVLVTAGPLRGLYAVSSPAFCRGAMCHVGTLRAGQTRVARFAYRFGAAPSGHPSVTGAPQAWARAEVTSTTIDRNGANDSASLSH